MENTTIDPKVLAAAQKLMAKKDKEMEARKAKYAANPNVLVETLHYVESAKKYAFTNKCDECGAEREIFTSDWKQVTKCQACTDKRNAAKKAAKAAEMKAALELLKSR